MTSQPACSKLPRPTKLHCLKAHLNSITTGVLGQLFFSREERQLRALLALLIEGFNHPAPRLLLAVVDLAEIQHLALHDLAPSTAPTLYDVPVTMLLAVFDSPIAAQVHLGVDCTQKLALEKILGLHYSHFEPVTPPK